MIFTDQVFIGFQSHHNTSFYGKNRSTTLKQEQQFAASSMMLAACSLFVGIVLPQATYEFCLSQCS